MPIVGLGAGIANSNELPGKTTLFAKEMARQSADRAPRNPIVDYGAEKREQSRIARSRLFEPPIC